MAYTYSGSSRFIPPAKLRGTSTEIAQMQELQTYIPAFNTGLLSLTGEAFKQISGILDSSRDSASPQYALSANVRKYAEGQLLETIQALLKKKPLQPALISAFIALALDNTKGIHKFTSNLAPFLKETTTLAFLATFLQNPEHEQAAQQLTAQVIKKLLQEAPNFSETITFKKASALNTCLSELQTLHDLIDQKEALQDLQDLIKSRARAFWRQIKACSMVANFQF